MNQIDQVIDSIETSSMTAYEKKYSIKEIRKLHNDARGNLQGVFMLGCSIGALLMIIFLLLLAFAIG